MARSGWGVPSDTLRRVAWLKERGRKHFSHFLFIGGCRGSKNFLGAIIACYELYRLLLLDDPQKHYGIAPGHQLRMYVAAVNYPQARDNQFQDILNLITSAPCFKGRIANARRGYLSLLTDADERRYRALGKRDAALRREMASIRVSAIPSNAPAARGAACTMILLDEFAHQPDSTGGPATADQIYTALTPSLEQMQGDGIVFVPTSPYTKVGRCFTLYRDGLAMEEETGEPLHPDFLVLQLPSWGAYEDWDDPEASRGETPMRPPVVYDQEEFERKRKLDPESFEVEYEAQWRDVKGAYLDPAVIDGMFEPFCPVCGEVVDDICPRCGEPARHLVEQDHGVPRYAYRAHVDVGETQSAFAAVIAHLEWMQGEDGEPAPHVVVDWIGVWRPEDYADRQLPYQRIIRELANVIRRFPGVGAVSFDQYSVSGTVGPLRDRLALMRHKATVFKDAFTERSNLERAESVKAGAGMGLIHVYRDGYGHDGGSRLEQELRALQRRNNKIEKQSYGPTRTKDVADCLMVVASALLKGAMDQSPAMDRLSRARLALGARGGYGTKLERPSLSRGRADLESFHERRMAAGTGVGTRPGGAGWAAGRQRSSLPRIGPSDSLRSLNSVLRRNLKEGK